MVWLHRAPGDVISCPHELRSHSDEGETQRLVARCLCAARQRSKQWPSLYDGQIQAALDKSRAEMRYVKFDRSGNILNNIANAGSRHN